MNQLNEKIYGKKQVRIEALRNFLKDVHVW